MQKGKNKRETIRYPALDPSVNIKNRQDEIDDMASYAHLLSPEELQWLNSFSEEYVCNNFRHEGDVLHNTISLKKDCSSRNNRRNKCLFNKKKSQKALHSLEVLYDEIKTSEEAQ